jgi:hypothetical protein
MNFTPKKYSQLKTRLRQRYSKDLILILRNLRKYPERRIVRWLSEHSSELKEFNSTNWLFLSNLQTFYFFCSKSTLVEANSFGADEEEIFEKWSHSEFADSFLKGLNRGWSLQKSSLKSVDEFDKHLVTFAERQILKVSSTSTSYRIQSSLGEFKKHKKIIKLLETTLHVEGKELKLMTLNLREMKLFSQRIENALKVIKEVSPSSWERFKSFTEVIVPIKQQELVSYSHQDLPGHSMINLYHRDFVDLMDDLLHENGHHHLNYYLNLKCLINESTENIYYSPWRKTLRPLRGVFHAYFTFFWAFKFFSDLVQSKSNDSIFSLFSDQETEKIFWRAIEEHYMLDYTYLELKWARKKGLIHLTGWNLIQEQQKEIARTRRLIPKWTKMLRSHKSDLKDLQQALDLAKKLYLSK